MSSDPLSPALSALEPSYEIIREIGRGGTSLVYLARERATNAEVTIDTSKLSVEQCVDAIINKLLSSGYILPHGHVSD